MTELKIDGMTCGHCSSAVKKALDLAGILVDADNVGSELRKTGTRHKADIARSDHCNPHDLLRFSSSLRPHIS